MQGRFDLDPAVTMPAALALVALALGGGGAGDAALGLTAVVIWALVGALLLTGGLRVPVRGRELGLSVGGLVALVVLTLLSTGWGAEPGAAFADAVRLLAYLGIVLMAALAVRAGKAASALAALALAGVLIALIALGARVGGSGADLDLARQLPLAANRISFPLGYWNGLGYLLAMSIPALGLLVLGARESLARLALAGSIPVVLVLYLTFSRGALLAAILGLLLVAVLCRHEGAERLRAAAAVLPGWLLVIAIAIAGSGRLGPEGAGAAFATLLLAAVAVSGLLCQQLFARLQARVRARRPSGEGPPLAADPGSRRLRLVAGIATAALLLFVPVAVVGELRPGGADPGGLDSEDTARGIDSGRYAFWSAATDAFIENPVRGIGAGGYESWWAANGTLRVSVRNAHSSELETLAELGLAGGLALAALLAGPLLAARRRLRESAGDGEDPGRGDRLVVASAVAVLLAGLIAITIDWSWEIPGAVAPLLIVIGLLCGSGTYGAEHLDPGRPSSKRPHALGTGSVAALAMLALLAGGAGAVLGAGAYQLDQSASRLAIGDVSGAARAARAANQLQPWGLEPLLRLAEIEQLADNLDAARRRAEEAARLAPQDYRPWVLLANIHSGLGNGEAGAVYLRRAAEVGVSRASEQRLPG